MKICLISFDYWNFDSHIINELKKRNNIEAVHINMHRFKYKHPSLSSKLGNFFRKTFLKKNDKKARTHEFIQQSVIKAVAALDPQDIILVIRPDVLDLATHKVIKQHTKKYFAYLYDSTNRFPVDHLLHGIFDRIFSFDENDVAKYGFTHISNYIYLPKKPVAPATNTLPTVFTVMSGDERLPTLTKIAKELERMGISFKFIIQAPKRPAGLFEKIDYSKHKVMEQELTGYMDSAHIFLDLIRHGHNGLSFRVFESLAYQKKLITTNVSVKNYEFYNPANIAIIDPDNVAIDPLFFRSPYEPLPDDVYYRYTISHWVTTVFFQEGKV